MTLVLMCINIIAQPKIIKMYNNQLSLIPVNVKMKLLNILCKRGFINDSYIFKQLVCPKVTEIDLSECNVTDDFLKCLFGCKFLQKLDLSLRRRQNRCITINVLNSLFLHLINLQILLIPHCKELNDEVIQRICETCFKLKELDISYSLITDLGLFYIGQSLCQLSVIKIQGTQISDLGMQYLIKEPLANSLREIDIANCPNLTPYSTILVAKKCPNITVFSCEQNENNEEMIEAINEIKTQAKQIFWNVI